jgi:hypothetical protein
MKNIFGYNMTNDKHNTTPDGQIFFGTSLPLGLKNTFDKALEQMEDVEKKLELPLWLKIIKFVSGCLAALISLGIIKGLSDVSLEQAYRNAPYLFYVTIIFFIIWFTLFLVDGDRRKKGEKSDEYKQTQNYADSVIRSSRDAFNIPPNAENVDVLSFSYKIKNGKMVAVRNGFVTYFNLCCTAYVRDGSLHLAFLEEEWIIPLHCVIGIKKTKKRISVPNWNKETPFNKGQYKQYNLVSHDGLIYFKPFYNICIKWNEEDYELSIPPYELDIFSSLIGLEFKE